jgi:hypothetical protein
VTPSKRNQDSGCKRHGSEQSAELKAKLERSSEETKKLQRALAKEVGEGDAAALDKVGRARAQ